MSKCLQHQFDKRSLIHIFCLLLPFILLPLALSPYKETKCSYVLFLVIAYWFLEPVNITVPALFPVVLNPLLGLVNSNDVCLNYMRETAMLLLGGFIMAIAVEECKLHERIALKILLMIGTDLKWLIFGFMIASMFISMWISITATCALMAPIAEAVLKKISVPTERYKLMQEKHTKDVSDTSLTESVLDDELTFDAKHPENHKIRVTIFLGICYAANLGGTGTIIGTTTNMVFVGILDELYPESNEITFTSWMLYNMPGLFVCIFIGWTYLWLIHARDIKHKPSKEELHETISQKYAELGSITCHEAEVIILFSILIFLWVLRDPSFVTGWAPLLGTGKKIGDGVPAIAISILTFILPSDIRNFKSQRILDWKKVQLKLPWNVLILVGGGFALAEGCQKSGLSKIIGEFLGNLRVLPPSIAVAITVFAASMITELMTNVVTATILLPSFSQMAIEMGVNPLLIMLPITIACSYAFMLPVAGPGNAISFDNGHMKTMEMVKPGFLMNIACCTVQIFMLNTLGVVLFDPYTLPSWANVTKISNNST